jgi:hypothetical protein
MGFRRIRWFIGAFHTRAHLEVAGDRQSVCKIASRPEVSAALARGVASEARVRALARPPVSSMKVKSRRASPQFFMKQWFRSNKCELEPVDSNRSADRIADGEKVWNSERFDALFHFGRRSPGDTSGCDGFRSESATLSRFGASRTSFLASIPPAEEAVMQRSPASTQGVSRYGATHGPQSNCGGVTPSQAPASKGGMGFAVVLHRAVSGQSRQALNEERAQI